MQNIFLTMNWFHIRHEISYKSSCADLEVGGGEGVRTHPPQNSNFFKFHRKFTQNMPRTHPPPPRRNQITVGPISLRPPPSCKNFLDPRMEFLLFSIEIPFCIRKYFFFWDLLRLGFVFYTFICFLKHMARVKLSTIFLKFKHFVIFVKICHIPVIIQYGGIWLFKTFKEVLKKLKIYIYKAERLGLVKVLVVYHYLVIVRKKIKNVTFTCTWTRGSI